MWLLDLLVGAIGGALSGLAVNIHSRKSDKKELQRISLEMVKIKIGQYRHKTKTITIDRLNQTPLDNAETKKTVEELQEILVDIKKDLIHCPAGIRKEVLSFHEICKDKDKSLLVAMLQLKQNKDADLNILPSIKKAEQAYSVLIKQIDKFLDNEKINL